MRRPCRAAHPERFWTHLGRALFVARRYAEAVEALGRIAKPDHTHHAFSVAALAQMGDTTGAKAVIVKFRIVSLTSGSVYPNLLSHPSHVRFEPLPRKFHWGSALTESGPNSRSNFLVSQPLSKDLIPAPDPP